MNMNRKQQSNDAESASLNAEALHEISRLQENILQTLRNELKKLKEPEVMGASNVSTPVHEIGEDMTPFPSVRASAVSFLKPVRQYSPLTPQRRNAKKLKSIPTKKHVDNSQNPYGIKYNYKTRDYPRPWADPPQRRRTISEESLEVHVTTSHFLDMNQISQIDSAPSCTHSQELRNDNGEDHEGQPEIQTEKEDAKQFVDPDRTESSEMWKKSIIFKSKPSKVLKYGINSKTNLTRTPSKAHRLQSQSPLAILNQMLDKTHPNTSIRSIQKAVVFPAPIPDCKKLKLKTSTLKQSSDQYGLPLQLFDCLDEANNNYIEDMDAKTEITSKAFCERLNETKKLCDLVYQKLMKSRSVQAITQQDETVQTDDILGSYSSEFELGLFIATLIDELIDAACEVTPQGIKSKSHNYSPGKVFSRSGPAKRRGIYETNILVPATRNPRARSEVTRNEQMKMKSIRRYAKAREGVKSPVKYTKPSEKESRERDQGSTKKLSNREQSLTIRSQSRSNRGDNIAPSLKKALKSITTSPIPKKDARVSPPPQQTNCPQRSLPTDNRRNRPNRRNYQISELDSTDSASLDSALLDIPSPQDWKQIGSLGKAMKDDTHPLPHLSTQQKQILSSLKTRKVKSKKIKKKLWWLFDSDYLDSSQGESPSISSLKSVLAEPEKQEELKDYFTGGEDFSDSSGPDLNNQIQQTYCNRLSLLKQPYSRSSRKRNIKMSYHPPDFADLFPYAGPILAEANKFFQNPNPGKIRNNSYWPHPSLKSSRLLSPLWEKEFTQ